eukprot:4538541-Pleurochrysis_carterae.AAC.1
MLFLRLLNGAARTSGWNRAACDVRRVWRTQPCTLRCLRRSQPKWLQPVAVAAGGARLVAGDEAELLARHVDQEERGALAVDAAA